MGRQLHGDLRVLLPAEAVSVGFLAPGLAKVGELAAVREATTIAAVFSQLESCVCRPDAEWNRKGVRGVISLLFMEQTSGGQPWLVFFYCVAPMAMPRPNCRQHLSLP